MYYHFRPLKYVEHGKVFPHGNYDGLFLPAYRWLGHYCGYCPQLWLSRGDILMTGARNWVARKKGRQASFNYRRTMHEQDESVLFGFDFIRGFPVDFVFWGCVLNVTMNMSKATLEEQNRRMTWVIDSCLNESKQYWPEEIAMGHRPWEAAWERFRPDFDAYLRGYVFVERDQVVVPSLNLKAAKKVICRNERQKKALRRMGFIEDRIEIRNTPR